MDPAPTSPIDVSGSGADLNSAPAAGDRAFTFRSQLMLVLSLLVLGVGVAVAIAAFSGAAKAARVLADSLFREASEHAATRARNHVLGVAPLVNTLAQLAPGNLALNDTDRLARQLADVLRVNDGVTWLSYSDQAGNFTAAYRTAEGTIRLNQSQIVNGKTKLIERDVLADNSLRTFQTDDDSGYDPRTREFYKQAMEKGRLVWLPPYVFFGTNVPGITAAIPVRGAGENFSGVITADFDLNALSKFIGSLSVSDHSRFMLFTNKGVLLAHPHTRVTAGATTQASDVKLLELKDVDDGVTRAYRQSLPSALGETITGSRNRFASFRFREGGTDYLASATEFRVDEGLNWVVGAVAPEDDFIGPARRGQRLALAIAVGAMLASLAIAGLIARRVSQPVTKLAEFMRRVGKGDLEARADVGGASEFRLLSSTLNQMIPDLQDRLKIRHALNVAMDVQQRLLPATSPKIPGLDIAGHSTYCDETGGDYYDFISIDPTAPGKVLVALGDVMGHGVAAALVMAAARAVLRDRSSESGSIAALLGRLNSLIHADLGGLRFMTMYLAIVDGPGRSLRWCSAGHDPAIVYDPTRDAFDEVDEAGFPLGVVDGADGYSEANMSGLVPGQIIFIGTDGIWEMQDLQGEQFGKDRLRAIIRQNATKCAAALGQQLLSELDEFRASGERKDDVTFVILKIVD